MKYRLCSHNQVTFKKVPITI